VYASFGSSGRRPGLASFGNLRLIRCSANGLSLPLLTIGLASRKDAEADELPPVETAKRMGRESRRRKAERRQYPGAEAGDAAHVYLVRIEDLSQGDFVKVDCSALASRCAPDADRLAEIRAEPRGEGARPGDAGDGGRCRAMIGHRGGDKPLTWLDGQPAPKKGYSKTAAQRPKRRCCEIPDRWVPSRREVLEIFEDGGVHPKATNDLHATSGRAVPCHRDPSRGDDMLNSSRKPGSHHLLVGQQGQDRE
jgi:hypothetical protein